MHITSVPARLLASHKDIGFNYNFDALHADSAHPNELYGAINQSLGLTGSRTLWSRIQSLVPLFYALV